ncbi:hypothetical protein KM043_014855 [Ampulex compressa]|nr:hypothetical protein KM043_014855 [Ampulex compressa]
MKVIALFLLQVIILQLARCQGGGGPSTFGYDASSACSRPYSRAGRARFINLPCDFRRQNWCTVAGSSYPWHAVRRFVQENQGLMRRMYGDERHINVLRAEFEKNDIELKYDDYYHHLSDEHRRYQYEDDYEFIDDDQGGPKYEGEEYEARGFTSRSFNDPTTKKLNKFPKLSEYTRAHFRPTEKPTSTATTTSTTTNSPTTMTTSSSTAPSTTTTDSSTISSTIQESGTKPFFATTNLSNVTILDRVTSNSTENATMSILNSTEASNEQNFSINEIPGQIDRIDEVLEQTVEESETLTDSVTIVESMDITTESIHESVEEEEESFVIAKETTVHESFVSNEQQQQQFRPRPEYRPNGKPEGFHMEGQLYQDVAAKDQQEQPVLKLRGVNACPVKEEVVAPFWANNTRGEVLALLNLYPFEQYVHWEKCTHENKQMYCRDGCRCEQQYRLHRLLAYDPNNECRGIFSDWFKFPSCCVCRCYDLPLEFRVTSRSPRTQKQRIKVQPPRSRYA